MDEDELCYQCQDKGYIAMLYLAQFAFLLIFMSVLFFASDSYVNQMEFILLNLRYVFAHLSFTASHRIVQLATLCQCIMDCRWFTDQSACCGSHRVQRAPCVCWRSVVRQPGVHWIENERV